MEKLGFIFKKFRQAHHLKLNDFTQAGISTSQLSRFERGTFELTVGKFIPVLDKMNVSLEEFMYVANGFKWSELR